MADKFKRILIPATSVLVVFVIAISALAHFAVQKRKDFVLYMKNGSLYIGSSRFDPIKLADDFEGNAEVKYTENLKKLFFPKNYINNGNEFGFDLHCIDLSNPQKDILISENVTDYKITKNGEMLVFLKDGSLYKSDIEENSMIKEGVSSFDISENGKKVIYLTDNGNLYFNDISKDVKISSDVEKVIFKSCNNYSDIYYIKQGDLYVYDGEESIPVAENVSEVAAIYKCGEVYFLREETLQLKLPMYLEDWWSKSYTNQSLYYYDGSKETKVSENLLYDMYEAHSKSRVIVFQAYDRSEMNEKISKITDSENVDDIINDIVYPSPHSYIAAEGTVSEIKGTYVQLNEDGSSVYYSDNKNIYRAEISDNKLEKAFCYQKDIDSFRILGDDTVVAVKEINGDDLLKLYDVYVNKEKVAEKVSDYVWLEDCKTFYFIEDCDTKNYSGKLVKYKNGKTETIDKNVCMMELSPADSIYYICDYNKGKGGGALCAFKSNEKLIIDKNVNEFRNAFIGY